MSGEHPPTRERTAPDMSKWALVPAGPPPPDDDGNAAGSAMTPGLFSAAGHQEGMIGGIFSTRKPKDALAGLSSGLKSAGKGIALGAVSLFAMPAVGAGQDGFTGFVKGLGGGVLAAIALPIAGVSIAVVQTVKGVAYTPEALQESHKGKKWDKRNRVWKENWYSLDEDAEQVEAVNIAHAADSEERRTAAPSSAGPSKGDVTVKDTKLYDVLGVAPNASQAEIRKSYYKLARDCHPDKNADDPKANKKFQAVGEAYQILGDAERRKKYNVEGLSAANDVPLIDNSLFFMMLFGSALLEPYIGKLKMTMLVEFAGESEETLTEEQMEIEQRKREVTLAVQLRKRLEPFVTGDDEAKAAWRKAMSAEAVVLCEASFGDSIVEAVGWAYVNYAQQFIGKTESFLGVKRHVAKFSAQKRSLGSKFHVGNTLVKTAVAARKLQRAGDESNTDKSDSSDSDETKKAGDPDTTDNKSADQSPSNRKTARRRARETPSSSSAHKQSSQVKDPADSADAGDADDLPQVSAKESARREKKMKKAVEDAKKLEEALPLILETMLGICLLDIETTLRKTCKKILKDMSVDSTVKRRRADALIELGEIMQARSNEKSKSMKGEKVDAKRQMEAAYIAAAQKADEDRHGAGM